MRYLTAILLVALVLLVTSCGKQTIDPEFATYVDSFERAASAASRPIHVSNSITFGTVSADNVNAQCQDGQVLVNRNTWTGLNESNREELIFHELGHCALNRGHDTDKHFDADQGIDEPVSIMYPSLAPPSVYEVHRQEYIDELFGSEK